jgi:DNA-binding MarR family transcriptional regulator
MGDTAPVVADVSDEELIESILLVSRAMVGVAVRSLAEAEREVTLPQYRTLVVLVFGGPRRLADLAATLAVSPSTATRMCDRLVRKGLVSRTRDSVDRREVSLDATEEGRTLVHGVLERRRKEVRAILHSVPAEARAQLASALELLARAAGESPDMHWSPGWHDGEPGAGTFRTPSAS